MSDQRFTLIDVMRGIRKHGLIDRLSPECFTFLIGLILEANELGFKNPIGMSTKQALSIGGGNTRQTVYNRRQKLSKFKIDGKPLVKVNAGSRAHNNVATYQIDYNLLCSYNGVWSMSAADMLNQSYSALDSGVDSALDSALTIHRSDQKRGEEIPPTPFNDVTTGKGPQNSGNEDGVFSISDKTDEEFEKIKNELRYRQVNEPSRSQLARKYDTRYLQRQMLQMDKDHLKKIKFDSPGGALVARIKSNHYCEDYPD